MSSVMKIESTKAKSSFAKLPARAAIRDLAITRHGKVQAYVMSPDRYQSLVSVAEAAPEPLQKLDQEFDAMVVRMQSARHRRAMRSLEDAPLTEILKAGAAYTARKKRKAR